MTATTIKAQAARILHYLQGEARPVASYELVDMFQCNTCPPALLRAALAGLIDAGAVATTSLCPGLKQYTA